MSLIKKPKFLSARSNAAEQDHISEAREQLERESKLYEEILQGKYDFLSIRTFTPEEKRTLDKQVTRAVAHIIENCTRDGECQNLKAKVESKTRGYTGSAVRSGIIHAAIQILETDLDKRGTITTGGSLDTKGARLVLSEFEIPLEDNELQSWLNGTARSLLQGNQINLIRELMSQLELDKEELGQLILNRTSLFGERNSLYDPVKIAEQLGIPKGVRDKIALKYIDALLSNENPTASAIVGKEDGVAESADWGPVATDEISRMIDSKNYPGAMALAQRLDLGEDLIRAISVLQRPL